MLAFLTAAASAVPGIVKIVEDIRGAEKKAAAAASVAADKSAPPAVQAAAARVAEQAIEDKASTEKAALNALSVKPTDTGSNTGLLLAGVAVLLLLSRR